MFLLIFWVEYINSYTILYNRKIQCPLIIVYDITYDKKKVLCRTDKKQEYFQ